MISGIACSHTQLAADNHRSGIYMRGNFNDWNRTAQWEFVDCGDNRYVLYDKQLFGTFLLDMRSARHKVDFILFGGNGDGSCIAYNMGRSIRHFVDCGCQILHCDSIVLIIKGNEATITLYGQQKPKPLPLITCKENKKLSTPDPQPIYNKADVLILGNSLSAYNHLPELIERIGWENGIDVRCSGMNRGGTSLQELWEIDTCASGGTLSPRSTVASKRWTHILLQDYSLNPLYNPDNYDAIVKLWTNYIKSHCPNHNVQIILAVNWPENNYWNFYTKLASNIMHNTQCAANNSGIALCPWGGLYAQTFTQHGIDATKRLYKDEIHPTTIASHIMASMLLAAITGEEPSHFKWSDESCDYQSALQFLLVADQVFNDCEASMLPTPIRCPAAQSTAIPWHIMHSHWKPLYLF